MNNDASSSTSNSRRQTDDDQNAPDVVVGTGPTLPQDEHRSKIRAQQTKRLKFLDHLVRNLDIVVFAELVALYYMDPSLFRFISRAIIQYIYFTPQPANFPPSPFRGPHLGLITLVNFGCLLVHIFAAAPEAGEAVRGYIHGGLFVDFVGEKGPISKVKLVIFDTLIVALQIILLAVDIERTELKKAMNKSSANSSDPSASPVQDLDSEERGLYRDIGMSAEDIELRPLRSSTSQANRSGETEEGEGFGSPTAFQQRRTDEHPENIYDGGQQVIANLHIIESIRTAWRGRYGEYAFAPNQAWTLSSRMPGGLRVRHSADQVPRGGSDTA